MKLNYFYKNRD